ncbi:hypothetical protein [uncultured Enorma sp.]|uniref:hypothetical protein n=1 Tax=uncultured Enorma sp. TaxID=1714346 RepID=UPI002804A9F1|nr:hypothetical protein [uncultured Enorma sp.]
MGLIVNKDELEGDHEYIDGIEVIERSDVPDDLPESEVEVIEREDSEDADTADEPVAEDDEAEQDETGVRNVNPQDEDAEDEGDEGASFGKRPYLIAMFVIAILVAGIGGYFIGKGGFGAAGQSAGTAVLTEDQLDSLVASYSYNGSEHDISAREAIESQYSLETVQNEDGTYNTPSAETLIAYVRTEILLNEADARGIEVTDDEVAAYAENTYGTSDYATLAAQNGVTEEQAQQISRDNAKIEKLYNQVVPAVTATVPEQPEQPADGDTSTRSAEYAQYIIELAGDEWDAEAGTWASTDGPYYLALEGMDFTADSASYEEAIIAYYVAYQEYATEASGMSQTWTEFANTLFADADIELYGVYA